MGEAPSAGTPADVEMTAAVKRYCRFWAKLRPGTTRDLLALARPDLRFTDPFNKIVGANRLVALLDHMFMNATEARFDVLHYAWADDVAFYRWDFDCRLKRPPVAVRVTGVSEVRFDGAGMVLEHIDHWDAASQVYERIPVLGRLVRIARRRLAFPG